MRIKLLPVVKAYPVIDPVSQTEAVCVAGITMEKPHRWVRLFPLDFRGLEYASRFKKYEVIELEVHTSAKDFHPESFTPVLDSIEVVEVIETDKGGWRRRLPYFDAVEDESMCDIQRRQKTEGKTLGVFRPAEVIDLKIGPAEKGFAESQRALLNQPSLFGDRVGDETRAALEPLPVKAKLCTAALTRRAVDSTSNRSSIGSLVRYTAVSPRLARMKRRSTPRSARSFSSNTVGRTTTRVSSPAACLNTRPPFLILGLVHPKRASRPQEASLF